MISGADEPLNSGWCNGPNTCSCPAGWHGTTGVQQCTHTKCGDGFVTKFATCTGIPIGSGCTSPNNPVEQCDDGNNIAGDGCSPTCQLEPPPAGAVRTTTQREGVLPQESVLGCEVDPATGVQRSCAVTPATVAATLGIPVEMICCIVVHGSGPTAEVTFKRQETVLRCEGVLDDDGKPTDFCENGGICTTQNGNRVCECDTVIQAGDTIVVEGAISVVAADSELVGKYRGYEGDTCEVSKCPQDCDHGGRCVLDSPLGIPGCAGCADGWTGEFCGTVDSPLTIMVVAATVVMAGMLGAAALLVIVRFNWVPIAARGPLSIVCSYAGGMIWLFTAVAQISGEMCGYDVAKPAMYKLWLPLVYGAGVWLASSIAYLRTMVKVHIFHTVPMIFPILLGLGLAPWILAAAMEKYWMAMFASVVCFLYTFTLNAQLHPLRHELPDAPAHAYGCMAGLIVIMVQLFVVQGNSVTASLSAESSADSNGSDATSTLFCSLATVVIVCLHFLGTSAKLCYLAVFRKNDQEVLKHYHDEYAPLKGSYKLKVRTYQHTSTIASPASHLKLTAVLLSQAESRRDFDEQVKKRRGTMKSTQSAPAANNSFRNRIAKTRGGGIAAASFKRVREKAPKAPKPLRVANASFKQAKQKAGQSATGRAISAVSFNRKQVRCMLCPPPPLSTDLDLCLRLTDTRCSLCVQFGARKKIEYKPKVAPSVQRARRASLADFNDRMSVKPNDGKKHVGFGAQSDVAAVAYAGGGAKVHPAPAGGQLPSLNAPAKKYVP